jgi:T5orf172 domain
MEPNQGIVYILTNPAMPGLIKLGITTQEDVKIRMSQLYTTGVPLPFECVYAALVKEPEQVERALQVAFGPDRVNPRREFFELEAAQAIAVIKLRELQDMSPNVAQEKEVVDSVELEAGEAFASRRPRFNFAEMNIPVGSELIFVNTGEAAIVLDERMVRFRETDTSLTNATRQALNGSYNVAPGPYWTYNGKRLRDIYDETYLREG